MNFIELLKKRIGENFQSKYEFSKKCGISSGHVSDILTGRRVCKKITLEKMLLALNLDKEKEKELITEWCFYRTEDLMKEDYLKLKEENRKLKNTLKKIKERIELVGV